MRSRARSLVVVSLLAAAWFALLGPAAAQVAAWRTQIGSEADDPEGFLEFYYFATALQSPFAATAADGSTYSSWSVLDGGLRSVLTRHLADGSLAWTKPFGQNLGGAIAVDVEGSAFVVGAECSEVIKVSAEGEVLWRAERSTDAGCVIGSTMLVASGDVVYAVSEAIGGNGVLVSRFEGDGTRSWDFVYEVADEVFCRPTNVAVGPDGSVLVTASHLSQSPDWNGDFLVLKVTPSGNLAWDRFVDESDDDTAVWVIAGQDGRVTVTGLSAREIEDGTGVRDYLTVQYSESGELLWSRRIERETYWGHSSWHPLAALAADPSGDVYLTGALGPDGAPALLLVKYGADGAELFRKLLPDPGEGRRVRVTDEDHVYLAATVTVGEHVQGRVLAFDSDGDVIWRSTTDSPHHVLPVALGVHADGIVLVADELGVVEDTEIEIRNPFWAGLDLEGDVEWTAGEPVKGMADFVCGDPAFDSGSAHGGGGCLETTADGSLVIAGTSAAGGDPRRPDHRVVKLDAAGAPVWDAELGEDPAVYGGGATALALGEDDAAYATGQNWVTVAFDNTGDEEWFVDAEGQSRSSRAVRTDSTGVVYVAGVLHKQVSPFDDDVSLRKYDPQGVESWTRAFAGPGGDDDVVAAMIVTADDRIVLAGKASVSTRFDALARAYDVDGDVLFTVTLDSEGSDAWLTALAEVPGSSDLVAAGRAKSETDYDALVVRLGEAGNVLWRRDLDGDAGAAEHGDDEATAVAVDPFGNVYIAGHTWNGEDRDLLVVKLEPDGNELWRRAIDFGNGDDEAWSAAFDAPGAGGAPGSLWIAGRASNGNDTDALTMRFDVDGDELFRALVAGTEERDDEHYDLVVGPVGHATVAGVSAEIDQSYNMQAIRYVTDPLDVDYDGEKRALSDGLVILRWLSGFQQQALTAGALGLECVRCPAETIDVHLQGIAPRLDVDGDGSTDPLTDGILLVRWLLGFRGESLTTGAVHSEECTRCDATAIETYLSGLDA